MPTEIPIDAQSLCSPAQEGGLFAMGGSRGVWTTAEVVAQFCALSAYDIAWPLRENGCILFELKMQS